MTINFSECRTTIYIETKNGEQQKSCTELDTYKTQ